MCLILKSRDEQNTTPALCIMLNVRCSLQKIIGFYNSFANEINVINLSASFIDSIYSLQRPIPKIKKMNSSNPAPDLLELTLRWEKQAFSKHR